MFTFETAEGMEHKVFFRYTWKKVAANPMKESSKQHTKPCSTKCLITTTDNVVLGKGEVTCYYKDNFSYHKGRKFAMIDAMEKAGLGRVDRKEAWTNLFAMENFKL